MGTIERLQSVVECHCRQVIDDDHPLGVDAVSGSANVVFELSCMPEDVGLLIGAPCSQGTDPDGITHVATILEVEKPLQKAVTSVVLEADGSAMAGEGVGHAEPRP